MPQPIICLDEEVCHFADRFRALYSKPQYQYFVTVLLGLMECEGRRTLSGLLQEVGHPPSLSGLSRFFSEAPWSQEAVVDSWLSHFRTEMHPLEDRRTRPAAPTATQAARSSQTALRDRVCDWGRLDHEQTERAQDGRIGQTPLDYR